MAAIEGLAESVDQPEGNSEPIIAAGNAKRTLDYLLATNARYAEQETEISAELESVRAQLQALRKIEQNLSAERKTLKRDAQTNNVYRVRKLRRHVHHPESALANIYRGVLLAVELGGGNLEDKDIFEQAHSLGHGLINLNHYVESSHEPQPLVVIRNIPSENNRMANLQFDFGYTEPQTGLEMFNDGEATAVYGNSISRATLQPWIEIPASADMPIHALRQSPDNSHFVWDDEKVVKVETDGLVLSDNLSEYDIVPIAGDARLKLPVGSLFPSRDNGPYIIHDTHQGNVESISLPGNLQGVKRDTLMLVGSGAIIKGLGVLPAQIETLLGEEKGRVTAAMVETVVRDELRLTP